MYYKLAFKKILKHHDRKYCVKILDFTRRQNDHRHTFDEGKQEQYGSRLGEKGEKKGGEKAEIEVRE